MIIGVDRLDYSKGLDERFLGYRRFLEEHDDWRGRVFLLQIAPPSRGEVHTYEHIREQLDELSGRINGEFAHVDWVPIRYVNQGYPRDGLAGFYRAADVGLVTPLRDGMNLVAKEYVAAQDPDDPGVLILSRFAGAAHQLKEALLVNPYSKDEISDAIRKALDMPQGGADAALAGADRECPARGRARLAPRLRRGAAGRDGAADRGAGAGLRGSGQVIEKEPRSGRAGRVGLGMTDEILHWKRPSGERMSLTLCRRWRFRNCAVTCDRSGTRNGEAR